MAALKSDMQDGVGGVGGGGNAPAGAGVANTGGGGAGAVGAAGAGGSGIVIVRNGRAAASYVGSPTITMAGSDFVYTFTGNGSITF